MALDRKGGAEPVVELLVEEWRRIDDLASALCDDEWELPTDCPGWSVRDVVAHVIGTELGLLGEPLPDIEVEDAPHVRNPLGAMNERWVAERRGRPGAAVLDEFRATTARRAGVLRGLTSEQLSEETFGPLGRQPLRAFLEVRLFDCWLHEQDARRATGRPGHLDGPIPAIAVRRLTAALPYIAAKPAALPDGTTIVVEVSGEAGETVAVGVEAGRGRRLDAVPAVPSARVALDVETFCCLAAGRWDAARVLGEGRARIEGDATVGRRLLGAMAIVP